MHYFEALDKSSFIYTCVLEIVFLILTSSGTWLTQYLWCPCEQDHPEDDKASVILFISYQTFYNSYEYSTPLNIWIWEIYKYTPHVRYMKTRLSCTELFWSTKETTSQPNVKMVFLLPSVKVIKKESPSWTAIFRGDPIPAFFQLNISKAFSSPLTAAFASCTKSLQREILHSQFFS